MSKELTFGSVCSGIEASQLAFSDFGFKQLWSSEIAQFPSKVLEHHFPQIQNLGDMVNIPKLILEGKVEAPDIFCGGTPCQAFSLAGWQNGLKDERGMLTMTFIELANAIDAIRLKKKKSRSIVIWENVEGVLNDKTNAFGNFIAGLAGFKDEIVTKKWTKSGFLVGPKRNVAWRVLDSKFFGLPHQRKRLYVLAGGKDFDTSKALFELSETNVVTKYKINTTRRQNKSLDLFGNQAKEEKTNFFFNKGESTFQIFREYTDCLYAAYGTKWNGNAAAYNGSLYVAENGRLRRFTPLECERLMGIPDNYTLVDGHSHTNRFQAVGNSWAVPVVRWIGEKVLSTLNSTNNNSNWLRKICPTKNNLNAKLYLLQGITRISQKDYLNSSMLPNQPVYGDLSKIVEPKFAPEKFYLSPKACAGILRRKAERNINMNPELEKIMERISTENNDDEVVDNKALLSA